MWNSMCEQPQCCVRHQQLLYKPQNLDLVGVKFPPKRVSSFEAFKIYYMQKSLVRREERIEKFLDQKRTKMLFRQWINEQRELDRKERLKYHEDREKENILKKDELDEQKYKLWDESKANTSFNHRKWPKLTYKPVFKPQKTISISPKKLSPTIGYRFLSENQGTTPPSDLLIRQRSVTKMRIKKKVDIRSQRKFPKKESSIIINLPSKGVKATNSFLNYLEKLIDFYNDYKDKLSIAEQRRLRPKETVMKKPKQMPKLTPLVISNLGQEVPLSPITTRSGDLIRRTSNKRLPSLPEVKYPYRKFDNKVKLSTPVGPSNVTVDNYPAPDPLPVVEEVIPTRPTIRSAKINKVCTLPNSYNRYTRTFYTNRIESRLKTYSTQPLVIERPLRRGPRLRQKPVRRVLHDTSEIFDESSMMLILTPPHTDVESVSRLNKISSRIVEFRQSVPLTRPERSLSIIKPLPLSQDGTDSIHFWESNKSQLCTCSFGYPFHKKPSFRHFERPSGFFQSPSAESIGTHTIISQVDFPKAGETRTKKEILSAYQKETRAGSTVSREFEVGPFSKTYINKTRHDHFNSKLKFVSLSSKYNLGKPVASVQPYSKVKERSSKFKHNKSMKNLIYDGVEPKRSFCPSSCLPTHEESKVDLVITDNSDDECFFVRCVRGVCMRPTSGRSLCKKIKCLPCKKIYILQTPRKTIGKYWPFGKNQRFKKQDQSSNSRQTCNTLKMKPCFRKAPKAKYTRSADAERKTNISCMSCLTGTNGPLAPQNKPRNSSSSKVDSGVCVSSCLPKSGTFAKQQRLLQGKRPYSFDRSKCIPSCIRSQNNKYSREEVHKSGQVKSKAVRCLNSKLFQSALLKKSFSNVSCYPSSCGRSCKPRTRAKGLKDSVRKVSITSTVILYLPKDIRLKNIKTKTHTTISQARLTSDMQKLEYEEESASKVTSITASVSNLNNRSRSQKRSRENVTLRGKKCDCAKKFPAGKRSSNISVSSNDSDGSKACEECHCKPEHQHSPRKSGGYCCEPLISSVENVLDIIRARTPARAKKVHDIFPKTTSISRTVNMTSSARSRAGGGHLENSIQNEMKFLIKNLLILNYAENMLKAIVDQITIGCDRIKSEDIDYQVSGIIGKLILQRSEKLQELLTNVTESDTKLLVQTFAKTTYTERKESLTSLLSEEKDPGPFLSTLALQNIKNTIEMKLNEISSGHTICSNSLGLSSKKSDTWIYDAIRDVNSKNKFSSVDLVHLGEHFITAIVENFSTQLCSCLTEDQHCQQNNRV